MFPNHPVLTLSSVPPRSAPFRPAPPRSAQTVHVPDYEICMKATLTYTKNCKNLPKIHERAACFTKFFEAQAESAGRSLAAVDAIAMADKEIDLSKKVAQGVKDELAKKADALDGAPPSAAGSEGEAKKA